MAGIGEASEIAAIARFLACHGASRIIG